MTNRIKSFALVLSGVVIGCGAAVGMKSSWAGPQPGKWTCYDVREFPEAGVWQEGTDAMNKIASSAPTGTVMALDYSNRQTVCVRD